MRQYRKGTVRERGKGTWQAILPYKDDSGKWKQKSTTFKVTSKRAADKKLMEWRTEVIAEEEAEAEQEAIIAAGGANPAETVADYVAHYIDGRATHIQSSSVRGYRGILNKEIKPFIGSVPLDDLTPDDVDKWLADLSEADYAPVSVKKAYTLLRSAMTQAVERDRLAKNPTRTVKPPKVVTGNPNALTEHDLGVVLSMFDVIDLTPAMLAAKIAICTGMRQGEICGMQWKNVDLENGCMRVTQAIGQGEDGLYIKSPKNETSKRTVYYIPELGQDLKNRKSEMEKECLANGVPFNNDMYVVGGVDGSFMQPHYAWVKWSGLADALNLIGTEGNRVTFHDLRHSYASIAIHNGIDVKTIANSMGHADASMTLNTYTSVDDDAQRRAAQAMSEALADIAERSQHGAKIIDVAGTEG